MEILLFLYFIVLCIAVFSSLLFIYGQLPIHRYKVPFISVPFPYIFGNISGEKSLPLQIANFYEKRPHDPIIGIRLLFNKRALVISDLRLVKLILVKNFECFQNRDLFYNEKDDPLSAVLGTAEHKEWQLMHRKLRSAFTPAKIKDMFPKIKNSYDLLSENLNGIVGNNGQMIEILNIISRFTTDAIGEIAFGKVSNESASLLRKMVRESKQRRSTFPCNSIKIAFPKFLRKIGMRKHAKKVSDFFVNFVADIVKFRKDNNVGQKDFMQSMIDSKLEISQIAAIAFDLQSTGSADSTSTLAYCLYELAMNKNIQNRARQEIESILAHEELSFNTLHKMVYINQIIKETERKYPVGGIATRIATKPFKVPYIDYTIPRGMKVFIPIYAIHHDSRYYRKAEVFDPDRFTEDARKERPEYSFLPFGKGYRQCIGYRFAEMFICTGLVTLLKNFEFSTCEKTEISIKFNEQKVTLHPKFGVTLNVHRI